MENVLDLLYEYSRLGREVDKDFSKKVIQIVSKEQELQKYLRKVKFQTIPEEEKCPLMYNFGRYMLQVDQCKLEQYYFRTRNEMLTQSYSEFELTLAANSLVLHGLLHDLEHANQLKKSRLNESFEHKLLSICLFYANELSKEDIFSRHLILRHGVFLNPDLYHNFKLTCQLKEQYDRLCPTERMANIQAAREINEFLKKLGKIENIEKVIELFFSVLETFYMKGYSETCLAPTENYLEDVQKLGFRGIEKLFNQDFYTSLEETKNFPLEERLMLGLPISSDEYHKVKTLGARKLK